MRPIAVLILVLGAAAALFFALTSITGSGERSAEGVRPGIAHPVNAAARATEALDQVVPPDVPVEAPAETRVARDEVEIAPGEDVRGAFSNWLEGTVLAPDGAPVANAQIELHERQVVSQFADVLRVMNGAPASEPYKRTKTDGSGYFRFGTLKPGRNWAVVVIAENFSRKEVGPVDVPEEGGVAEKIVLDPGFVLQGHVREELSGAPVAGAILALDNPAMFFATPAQRGTSNRLEAVSDDSGFYRFANVSPGQWVLECRATGYGTQQKMNVNFANAAERTLGEDFALKPAMMIAGRVLGPSRAGVEGILIDAFSNSQDPGCRSTTTSGGDGEFVLDGLNEGFYTLKATAPGYDVDPVMRIEAGATDIEIQLYEQGAVLGKVVDAASGRPISDFTCIVRKLNKQSRAWGAQIAVAQFQGRSDGSFQMGGISEGQYVMQADARGYASSFSQEFTVAQGISTPDIEVRMTRGGILKGRVVDATTGQPVARAQIQTNDNNHIDSEFTNLLSNLQPSALTRANALTDSEGNFEIKLLTPETYQLKVFAAGYTQHVQNDVSVGDGLPTEVPLIKLSQGATISGVVFGPEGQPAPGCTVSLSRTDGRLWSNVQGRTDANGRFELRHAPAGDYKLAAARPRDGQDSPFGSILDMKNSEVMLTIVDGQQLEQNLYLSQPPQ